MEVGGQQMAKLCGNAHVDCHINFPVPQKCVQMWHTNLLYLLLTFPHRKVYT